MPWDLFHVVPSISLQSIASRVTVVTSSPEWPPQRLRRLPHLCS